MKLLFKGVPTVLHHGDRGVITKMPQDELFCIIFYRDEIPLSSDRPDGCSVFLLGVGEQLILDFVSLVASVASLKEKEVERTPTNWTFMFEQQT